MVRHLRVLAIMWRNALVREMQFRANFAIRVVTEVFWLGIMVLYLHVVFGFTDSIAGWDKNQTLLLLGVNYVLLSLFEAFFFDGCYRLADEIRQGDLDFILLKPVNTRFLASLRHADFAMMFNVALGAALIVDSLSKLRVPLDPLSAATFLWLTLAGIGIYYSLVFSVAALTFWMGRSNNLFDLYWQLGQFGRYPGDIYRYGMRLVLMTVLPMIVVTNFPARALFEGLPFAWTAYATGLCVLGMILSGVLWRRGLERYRSASS